MKAAPIKAAEQDAWRDVHPFTSWDEADAQRQATIRDNPTLDVRLDPRPGKYVLQVRGPNKR